ncbi:hypothetical protein D3C81_2077290 [compost metagenome]
MNSINHSRSARRRTSGESQRIFISLQERLLTVCRAAAIARSSFFAAHRVAVVDDPLIGNDQGLGG